MEAKNFKHQYEVADALGFKRVAFSERKKRNSPPIAEIELFCHKEFINPDFVFKGHGDVFVAEVKQQPQTIAEQIGFGYGPEVKLMADYAEVKLKGKTAEERLQIVEEIMEQIRSKYK
jgi:hypothetical protein